MMGWELALRRLVRWVASGLVASGAWMASDATLVGEARAQEAERSRRARAEPVATSPRESRQTVLLVEGATPDWIRRVRGQLSDLPASIRTTTISLQGLSESELEARLEELAAARHATLVAWISIPNRAPRKAEAGDATTVSIWFAESKRFYARQVARHWSRSSASDRSGALELAALSVRSAVRSLLLDPASAGAALVGSSAEPGLPNHPPGSAATAAAGANSASKAGSNTPSNTAPSTSSESSTPSGGTAPNTDGAPARSSPTAAPAAPAATGSSAASPTDSTSSADVTGAPRAATPSPMPKPPLEEPQIRIALPTVLDRSLAPDSAATPENSRGSALDLHWRTELGVIGRLYGEPALGAAAFEAGVHAGSGDWGFGVMAQLTLPTNSDVGPAELQLHRYALLAEGQYAAWQSGPWSLCPLLRAGLALIARQTVSHDATIVAERSDTHESPVFTGGLATEYRPLDRLGLMVRGVLQWEPIGSKYAVVDRNGAPISSAQPWLFQPALELSGIWYW